MNKKAQTGWAWIYGLLILFVLGLMYVIFNQVLTVHIVPIVETQIDDNTNRTYFNQTQADDLKAENDRYMALYNSMPYVLLFVVIIFIVAMAVRARNEETQ